MSCPSPERSLGKPEKQVSDRMPHQALRTERLKQAVSPVYEQDPLRHQWEHCLEDRLRDG